ncbi:MAG: sigma-54 dependent transcriptional regulator [Candidatus Marinimicrobia bacterium]|nr:sigma-54 dependent transcriptional regulator [Candidatus Neomarinimicrobiota bacterium]
MTSLSILVIDDDQSQREVLSGFMKKKGYNIFTSDSGEDGLKIIKKNYVDLVITDFKMPGINGLEVLQKVKDINPEIAVMIITAFGTIKDSVQAMKNGAWDYLSKPIDLDELEFKLEKLSNYKKLLKENESLRSRLAEESIESDIVYKSSEMEEVINMIARVSQSNASVFIMGESGTGKEMVARAIHGSSPRSQNPFVPVNCAAIPETLFESEFFGHEKGAFTGSQKMHKGHFEISDGGTLFLDEVADIPLNFQVKLLRALQEKEFQRLGSSQRIKADIRIISATNQDIKDKVKNDQFRSDLFFRLNVIPITIPPLRERKDDIPLLVNHFIEKYSRQNGVQFDHITTKAMDNLMRYSFPGNVRELENLIERAVILCRNSHISCEDIALKNTQELCDNIDQGLEARVANLEKKMIIKALEKSNYVKTEAAAKLKISERVIRYKIKKYNIET